MELQEFTSDLDKEMDRKLSEINSVETKIVQRLKFSSSAILQFLFRLKAFVTNYKFLDKADEINFFKNIKPKFLSKLIYYRNAFEIQSHLPFGSAADKKKFLLKELNKISQYQKDNKEFISYYRANSIVFDEVYFIRKEPDSWLTLNFDSYETDLNFTTFYDLKISKIIAYELLSEFIKMTISKIEVGDELKKNYYPDINKLKWTAPKVSLIELLYALQSSGAFNNGSTNLKNLAETFENLFHVDLGNYYRTFQEIRIRKESRTTFLDQLKERLIQRMDESDENPKFS